MATGWRPTQWSKTPLTSITVKQTTNVQTNVTAVGTGEQVGGSASTGGTTQQQSTIYFFDGVPSVDHYTVRRFTDHPIQSGTSVVDHSYQLPDRVIISGLFSDAMQSYQSGQYGNGAGRSVNAYQTFVNLQKTGAQIQLATRLQQYLLMGIEEIRASDTERTLYGADFTVVFRQLIIANATVTQPIVSSRPNTSQSTNAGSLQPTSTDPSVLLNHTSSLPVPPELQGDPNPQLNSDGSGYQAGYAAPGYAP
jgi:hypothetical protein